MATIALEALLHRYKLEQSLKILWNAQRLTHTKHRSWIRCRLQMSMIHQQMAGLKHRPNADLLNLSMSPHFY
ncbi:unnamed protein product [Strongylus vulgaris]|uniref:Uncharacterized protein n=1 Tax=Strongylus vulgaris TaxID=40348 RepID=A0A3P7IDE7_STRVU|nr:unnamed protein product [Strongylus vulgaris]